MMPLLLGQSEGQFEGFIFQCKCNDPNGLSLNLTPIQNLESYRWTISHPSEEKNESQRVPDDRESHDSTYLI